MSCNDIVVICPHCKENVLIEQLNCQIFRHGVMKTTGEQIDPHANKEICDNLFTNHLIYMVVENLSRLCYTQSQIHMLRKYVIIYNYITSM